MRVDRDASLVGEGISGSHRGSVCWMFASDLDPVLSRTTVGVVAHEEDGVLTAGARSSSCRSLVPQSAFSALWLSVLRFEQRKQRFASSLIPKSGNCRQMSADHYSLSAVAEQGKCARCALLDRRGGGRRVLPPSLSPLCLFSPRPPKTLNRIQWVRTRRLFHVVRDKLILPTTTGPGTTSLL